MVKITKNIVNRTDRVYGYNNKKKYITIHETANTSKGADAATHGRLQQNGFSASWHYTVDDKQAVQSFPHSAQCWHAGDGKGNGNLNSIGIEICVNSDGDFKKAVKNAAELVKKIMKDENISLGNVVQHHRWSGKNCPANLRSGSKGINWNDFINLIKGEKVANAPEQKVKSTPSKPKTNPGSSKANLVVDGYWGRETTKALQRSLGTVADGEIWGQVRNQATQAITGGVKFGSGGSPMIRALQKKVNSKQDGYLGANTIRSLQRYLKTPADGELWKPSTAVKEMQRRLNAGNF